MPRIKYAHDRQLKAEFQIAQKIRTLVHKTEGLSNDPDLGIEDRRELFEITAQFKRLFLKYAPRDTSPAL